MLGQRLPVLFLASLLLVPLLAPPGAGQAAGDRIVVNGEFPPLDAQGARALRKTVGVFQTEEGRVLGQSIAFGRGTCGAAGDCVVNLSAGPNAAPAIASLAIRDGGATLAVAGATATLSSGGATVTLAAVAPGFGAIHAVEPSIVAIRLAEGAGVTLAGAGILSLGGGEATPLTLVAPGAAVTAQGRDVTVDLPAGGRAYLLGPLEKGIGGIPGGNATGLVRSGAVGGLIAAARVNGTAHATVVDLAGDVDSVALAPGRFTATVTGAGGEATLFALNLAPGVTTGGAMSTFTILVDGRLVPRVPQATMLWSGATPRASAAFASQDGAQMVVAVPGEGQHVIEVLQAGGAPIADGDRRPAPSARPTGIAGTAPVGSFEDSTGRTLAGTNLRTNLTTDGGDVVLTDLSYPGLATPLFRSVRIAGGGSTSFEVDGSVATFRTPVMDARLYDALEAWVLLEARAATTLTFTPADGVTLQTGGGTFTAFLDGFHVHFQRWPGAPPTGADPEPLPMTVDAATGAVIVEVPSGERLMLAAHPGSGPNAGDFHGLLGAIRNGNVEGIRQADYDEDEGEATHWVGFGAAPEIVRYENGVAQIRLDAEAGNRLAILDLTPAFMRPFDPATFTVNFDGREVPRAAAPDGFNLAGYRSNVVTVTGTPEEVRAVVHLPNDSPHTVTMLQHQAPPTEDPGQRVIGLLTLLTVVLFVVGWYVAKKWEPAE